MPAATPEIYAEMIDRAKQGGFEAESYGIVQVSTGGAGYWSGASTKDMVAGSLGSPRSPVRWRRTTT